MTVPFVSEMQCPVCGSNVSRIKYDLDAKLVFGCRQCGLVLAKAKHGQPEVRLESSGQEESHREKYVNQFWEFRRKSFRRGIDLIEKWNPDKGTVLDIGCSYGLFLSIAQERGWEVHGIEASPDEIRFCKERFGIEVEQADINQLNLPDRHYELVTLWDVLEHSTEPSRLLASVHQSLRPNGVLLVRVPDRKGLFPRLCSLAYTLTRGRYKYPLEKLFEFHWFHFDRKTVSDLLRKANFRITKSYGEDYININAVGEKEYGGNRFVAAVIKIIIIMARALNMRDEVVVIAQKIG